MIDLKIDATLSIAALLGGLVGALATAYLSYRVQVAVREWEDRRRRGRILYVHYLAMTMIASTDKLASELTKTCVDWAVKVGLPFENPHKVAAWCAELVSESGPDILKRFLGLLEAYQPTIDEMLKAASVDARDLADFPQDAVLSQAMVASQALTLRSQYALLLHFVNDYPSSIDAGFVHGIFRAWRGFADAAILLRSQLANALKLSPHEIERDFKRGLAAGGALVIRQITDAQSSKDAIAALKAAAEGKPTTDPTPPK